MTTAIATITGGWIGGFVALAVFLGLAIGLIAYGFFHTPKSLDLVPPIACIIAGLILIPVTIGVWWWASAFSTSGEYHAWNVKQGTVSQISKRIVPAGDNGIQERYVVRFGDEQLYGIDDTRASLLKPGDTVRLKCKRDWQWGIPRESQGWACRWAMKPGEKL